MRYTLTKTLKRFAVFEEKKQNGKEKAMKKSVSMTRYIPILIAPNGIVFLHLGELIFFHRKR
jgi:hypothetical protein